MNLKFRRAPLGTHFCSLGQFSLHSAIPSNFHAWEKTDLWAASLTRMLDKTGRRASADSIDQDGVDQHPVISSDPHSYQGSWAASPARSVVTSWRGMRWWVPADPVKRRCRRAALWEFAPFSPFSSIMSCYILPREVFQRRFRLALKDRFFGKWSPAEHSMHIVLCGHVVGYTFNMFWSLGNLAWCPLCALILLFSNIILFVEATFPLKPLLPSMDANLV